MKKGNTETYKNYRSKFSNPLVAKLEEESLFRKNPRLIARVVKFMSYIAFLQLNSKCPTAKIGTGKVKDSEKRLKFLNFADSYVILFNSLYYSYSHILTTSYTSPFYTPLLSTFTFSPNYSIDSGRKTAVSEPYFLKLASIHWTKREDILGEDYYSKVVKVLSGMGIIYCDFTRKAGKKTYGFALTEYGYALLMSSHKEYIYEKIYGKGKRNIQRRLKRSGYYDLVYSDPILQNAKQVIDGIDNLDEMLDIAEGLEENSKLAARHLIDSLKDKDYKKLKILDHTGRFYSPLHMLPKPVKQAARINGKVLADSIDVRSCHPTLLGLWIQKLADTPSPELDAEIRGYNHLFCDPKHHPREVIREQILVDSKREFSMDEIKKGLNTFINGSKGNLKKGNPARYLKKWLEENYPTMFEYWRRSNIKQTGNNIARIWEQEIFRSTEVLDKANELGVIIMDNHDELLIFGSIPKAKKLIKWFKERAKTVTGLNIQFSGKDAA